MRPSHAWTRRLLVVSLLGLGAVAFTTHGEAQVGATFAVSVNSGSEAEGGSFTFTVVRTGNIAASGTVDYAISGAATAGVDYTSTRPVPTGSLTFPAFSTATQTVVLQVVDDVIDEPNEGLTLTINPVQGTATVPVASATIQDNDVSVVRITGAASMPEAGGTAMLTLSRAGTSDASSPAITVDYSRSGSAIHGTDYVDSQSGSVTIPAGQAAASWSITALDDGLDEVESVTVTLQGGAGYSLASPLAATVAITDDDLSIVSMSASSSTIAEAGATVQATFTRSNWDATSPAVAVSYSRPGTATVGTDFLDPGSGTRTIPPGQASVQVTLTAIQDGLDEVDETFTLTLQGGPYATTGVMAHAVTILDDDEPETLPDAVEVAEDSSLALPAPGILGNDGANVVGMTLAVSLVDGPAAGFLSLSPDGAFQYTPGPDFFGQDSFTYRAGHDDDWSAATTVTIDVLAVNDSPTYAVTQDSLLATEDDPPASFTFVESIDGGPGEGDTVTLRIEDLDGSEEGKFDQPPGLDAQGTISYALAANRCGIVSFTVVGNDGQADGPALGVVLDVACVNDGLVALDDAYLGAAGATEDVEFVVPATDGLLANDADPDGPDDAGLAVTTVGPQSTDGSFAYLGAPDFFGFDSFGYTVCDDHPQPTCLDGQARIEVTPVNDAPRLPPTSFQVVHESHSGAWSAAAPDPEGDPVSYAIVMQPTIGAATLDQTGWLDYTPPPGWAGTDSMRIEACDDQAEPACAEQEITIDVVLYNDPPTFALVVSALVRLEDSGPSQATVATGMDDGSPYENDELQFLVVPTAPALFATPPIVDAATGVLSFTPASNACGSSRLDVTLDDGGDENRYSATLSLVVTLTCVNDPPSFLRGDHIAYSADDLAYPFVEDLADDLAADPTACVGRVCRFAGWATQFEDGDPEASQALSMVISNNRNQMFSVQPAVDVATGDLTFTLAPDGNGIATVSLRVMDNGGTAQGGSNRGATTTFRIRVQAVNDEPSFTPGPNVAQPAGVAYAQAWASTISAGPTDEAVQTVTFVVDSISNGMFQVSPAVSSSGVLSFTIAPGTLAGTQATITLHAQDSGGTSYGGDPVGTGIAFTITAS